MSQTETEETETEDLIHQLAKIEVVAEDILNEKQQIVDLDAKRNKCREASRSLKLLQKTAGENPKSSWVCFGNTFIKMDTSKCAKMLESDQKTIDNEIDRLRDGLKPKVAQLHRMEGRPEVRGFDLKGMKVDEVLNIT